MHNAGSGLAADAYTAHDQTLCGFALADAHQHEVAAVLYILRDDLVGSVPQEVPVFTRKAVVWEEVKRLGFVTAVSIEAAFYFQNFNAVPGLGFSKGSDGNAVFTVPMLEEGDRLAGFDVGDTGQHLPLSKCNRCLHDHLLSGACKRAAEPASNSWADMFSLMPAVHGGMPT